MHAAQMLQGLHILKSIEHHFHQSVSLPSHQNIRYEIQRVMTLEMGSTSATITACEYDNVSHLNNQY